MSKKNQPEEKPSTCPFCGHEDLAPSPSGKHLVCRKCNRIVLTPKPTPAGRKGTKEPTC
jgi:ribosomal protein S27E